MVALLVVLTVLGCIAVDLAIKRREKAAADARLVREPSALFPTLTAQELPGGLFVHGGHTWAKLDASGAVQVGLDDFAQKLIGRVAPTSAGTARCRNRNSVKLRASLSSHAAASEPIRSFFRSRERLDGRSMNAHPFS